MIQYFRDLLETLRHLTTNIASLATLYHDDIVARRLDGDSEARLVSLELSRLKWQGEMEALVIDAKGQYRAAANAEGRAKTHAKAAEVFEESDEESEEDLFTAYVDELSRRDVSSGEIGAVQAVRDNMGYGQATARQIREAEKAQKRERRA